MSRAFPLSFIRTAFRRNPTHVCRRTGLPCTGCASCTPGVRRLVPPNDGELLRASRADFAGTEHILHSAMLRIGM